jgi:hypothetical protein
MICSARRYTQLERVHATAELLRQFRFGCRLTFINQEIAERLGESHCERTTRRDLEFLELLGLIEVERGESRGIIPAATRYHWAGKRSLIETSPAPLLTIESTKGGAS